MPNLIFTFEDGSEYLCHYGVLGMKWGVRKDESRVDRLNKDSRKLEKFANKTDYNSYKGNRTKSLKYSRKATNQARKMRKRYSEIELRSVPDSTLQTGRDYLYYW